MVLNIIIYNQNLINKFPCFAGDWGLGIGPNPQSPIPNPQSPNQFTYFILIYDNLLVILFYS